MQEKFLLRIQDLAENYSKFMELSEQEQEWLLPLMSNGNRKTIEMLKLISTEKLTFEQIANEIDCHSTTVTQKLNALSRGGMGIEIDKAAFLPTGRPRKLIRKRNRP